MSMMLNGTAQVMADSLAESIVSGDQDTSSDVLVSSSISSMDKVKAEKEFNLIVEATDQFDSGDYDKCLDTMEKVVEYCGQSSVKLLHNRAVVKFYKSKCTDHSALLAVLNELNLDEDNPSGTTSMGTIAIAKYNKAMIYYHRHMYQSAIETLLPVVEKLVALESTTAANVAVLMIRLLLATNELRKAQAFLEHFQSVMGFTGEPNSPYNELALPDTLVKIEDFGRTYKLLHILTSLLNNRPIALVEDGSTEMAELKAYQFYLTKDFQMAAKQLMKISMDSQKDGTATDELNTCIANNMGVIHLRVRHYAIAAQFFQNAIMFDKQIASNLKTAALHEMSSARSCEILYNLGISMLYLRRPREAFQCFLIPLKTYHTNPRIWVRIAESCIMEHESVQNDKSMSTNPQSYPRTGQLAAVPEPTLQFAALSLRNALTMTMHYKQVVYDHSSENSESEEASTTIKWSSVKDNNFCNPSRPVSREALNNILIGVYAAYSYVSLRLGDFVTALDMAQKLLEVEKISDAHKMLGHMYAGEALIMQERFREARPHLEPSSVSTLNAFDFETKDWQLKSLEAAQSVVRYNLAVALALQRDFKTAEVLLSTCTHPIVIGKIPTLMVYLRTNRST